MTHTPPCPVKLGKESIAFWSLRPIGQLAVFVHGFRGSPTTTWVSFPQELLTGAGFGVDFLFYGYESLRQGAEESGVQLYDSLFKLWQSPALIVNESLSSYPKRSTDFHYSRVTLIAHSLGAAVSRQAMIEHYRALNPWGTDIRLVLFAPAHKGANGAKLIGETLACGGIIGSWIGAALELQFQSIRDLKPESQFLKSLVEESRRAIISPEGLGAYITARKVIWVEADRVVINQRFLDDPKAERVEGRTHVSVCKPDAKYSKPVTEVMEAMS